MRAAPGAVVVVGSTNADLIVQVERRPGAGETVLGGDLVVRPGGKGANQAVAAARLGAGVTFVGCVGSDAYAGLLVESLVEAGVDVRELRRVPGPSGSALITVTPDGDNSIVVSPGANARMEAARLDELGDTFAAARIAVLQCELRVVQVSHRCQRRSVWSWRGFALRKRRVRRPGIRSSFQGHCGRLSGRAWRGRR